MESISHQGLNTSFEIDMSAVEELLGYGKQRPLKSDCAGFCMMHDADSHHATTRVLKECDPGKTHSTSRSG